MKHMSVIQSPQKWAELQGAAGELGSVELKCCFNEHFLQPAQKYLWVSQKKGVNATKPNDKGEEGQGSKGQRATLNQHICQEIFSVFTSSSGVLSSESLWYSGNTNTAHMQLIGIQTKL